MYDAFECRGAGTPANASINFASQNLAPVIALHCSGADGRQWRKLAGALGPRYAVRAPDLIGCGDAGHWHGERAFTLMAEAVAIVDLAESLQAPVHLVGHSYGGAVALMVAGLCPARIASLTLYEPSAFHILKQCGRNAARELLEIETLSHSVSRGLLDGAFHRAASEFVDFWGGSGTWGALRPQLRDEMIRWLPSAPLNFRALLEDDTPLASYRQLTCPTLLMRGERTRAPSRLIVDELARRLPACRTDVIAGAGHMGPVTHADAVLSRIASHIHDHAAEGLPVADPLAA